MAVEKAPWAARVTAGTVILNRGWGKPKETADVNVRHTLKDLVLGSMGRRREQFTQWSPPFIDITPTKQKSEEMGKADLSRSP